MRTLVKLLAVVFLTGMIGAGCKAKTAQTDSNGKTPTDVALAFLTAANQGKYIAFHRRIMMARLIPTAAYIEEVAKRFGMDLAQLREDMVADKTTRALRRNARLASALGLIGTPALVVGRTIVQGGITRAQLARLIEIELRSALPRTC